MTYDMLKGWPQKVNQTKMCFSIPQFGHGLQQMLSTVPYSEVSGQRNIEWDSIMLCANFMKMWAMVPQVVKDMSGHHDSQEKLPDDTIDKLINSMYVFERSLNIFFLS